MLLVLALGWLLLLGSDPRAQEKSGSYWYALDNLRAAEADAEALIWVSLPASWHGQEFEVTAIDPKPVAVLTDHRTGNQIIEWRYRPDSGPLPMSRFFHFDFTLREKPVGFDVDPARIRPYDRADADYLAFTRSETWIETDGEVRDAAREIVGEESNPWLQARVLFDWCLQSMTFVPGGFEERDARSTLLNRRGDCGQYSRLFTAFCRSLGIPARTVTNAWLSGGTHVFAEVLMPGYGWVPVDVSLAQMLLPDGGGFTPAEVEAFMSLRGVPRGDPAWLMGHLFGHRVITSVGNNITVDSPTLGHPITFQSMRPGGDRAHPPAFRIRGFNEDLVHGGFFVFGDRIESEDQARSMAHMRLANKFFNVGLHETVEDDCRKSLDVEADGVQAWVNMGKVYMHKGQYYKAEASFKRAMGGLAGLRDEKLEAKIWTHNYLGNCYDMLHRRDMARKEYQVVVDMGNNYRGAVDYARRYLARPFAKKAARTR